MKYVLPLVLTLAMAAWFLGGLSVPPDKDFAFHEFGRLPVIANGRLQPMDSLARNALLNIRNKSELNAEPWKAWNQHPQMIPATEWLANVMMNPAVANDWPVFRVDNPDLISLLKLPEKDPAKKSDGQHYSWNQLQPVMPVLDKEDERVEKIESASRSSYENAVVKLHEQGALYLQLQVTLQPADAIDWPRELAAFEQLAPEGVAAVKAEEAGQPYNLTNFNAFAGFIQRFQTMSRWEPPLVVPSTTGTLGWQRAGDALLDVPRGRPLDPVLADYAAMCGALADSQPEAFNAAVRDARSRFVPAQSAALHKADAEVFFNQMEPFYKAMVIYIIAGLLAVCFWFNLSETLRRSAMWLILLAFTIHTFGLVYRMWLEGRPPVTNLYSSAIFIGWGAVLLGLILERFHKNGIGACVSSVIGFITLIIAHHLALEGDTMEMMRAVLDTNFWLATHVVAVTVGYASTYVAGFLALIYILRGVFTKTLDEATGRSLARMVYGIVCFATLFSFVGTVLGGIWADQSWGRFWGWDPKENGALIIVLWNALILHLRWGGMIRERGLINCAIFGNVVTAWSWFGVNMLGIGLHSYGFTDAAFKWLILFVLSQLGFIVLGMLPANFWRSFRARPNTPAA
jgi:ABC-type transport system involved in cytochrome c biogenesis permease subunit